MLTIKAILDKKGNNIISVRPDQTVYDALLILADKGVGALLVMDGEKVCGIFSERDYARKIILKGQASKDVLVQDIMTKDLITSSSGTSIFAVMELMTKNHIRHLPIMDDGKLMGLISLGDVVTLVINSQKETIESLESYIKGGSYS